MNLVKEGRTHFVLRNSSLNEVALEEIDKDKCFNLTVGPYKTQETTKKTEKQF